MEKQELEEKFIASRLKAIKVRAYNTKTDRISTYQSIHAFKKDNDVANFSKVMFEDIKNSKLIRVREFYLCKKDADEKLSIMEMIEARKKDIKDRWKFRRLSEIQENNENVHRNAILIMDENFCITNIFTGKLIDLAAQENINYNTMKSIMFRHKERKENFYKGIETKSYNGKNFCYLNDY